MWTKRILRLARYAHYFLGTTLFVLSLAVLVSRYALTIFRVDGHSMDTTLRNGQLLAVCLVCTQQPIQKGGIYIVQYQGNSTVRFVKRVVALPGDTVVHQGAPLVLPAHHYYVVGDNREHSTDSRDYGPVPKSAILGRVLGFYPPGPSFPEKSDPDNPNE
jgi:signal peptidase I